MALTHAALLVSFLYVALAHTALGDPSTFEKRTSAVNRPPFLLTHHDKLGATLVRRDSVDLEKRMSALARWPTARHHESEASTLTKRSPVPSHGHGRGHGMPHMPHGMRGMPHMPHRMHGMPPMMPMMGKGMPPPMMGKMPPMMMGGMAGGAAPMAGGGGEAEAPAERRDVASEGATVANMVKRDVDPATQSPHSGANSTAELSPTCVCQSKHLYSTLNDAVSDELAGEAHEFTETCTCPAPSPASLPSVPVHSPLTSTPAVVPSSTSSAPPQSSVQKQQDLQQAPMKNASLKLQGLLSSMMGVIVLASFITLV